MKFKVKHKAYEKMLVFDATHLAYRNFHTLRSLTNPKGLGIGCVYGVIGSIKKAARQYPEHRIVFCWDRKPTVRKDLYPEYKAHRGEKPEWYAQFLWQMEQLKKCLKVLDVDQYEADGYEADDLGKYMVDIRTKEYPEGETVLVTSDTDWLQMVNDDKNVSLYDPIKDKFYNEEAVEKKLGLSDPAQLAMYKSIKGDKSDNVPSILRFPNKTAIHLARKCPTPSMLWHYLEGADPNRPKHVSDKWKQVLIENKEQIELNFKLVYLGYLKPQKLKYTRGVDDLQNLKAFYREHGFKSYLAEYAKQDLIKGKRPSV